MSDAGQPHPRRSILRALGLLVALVSVCSGIAVPAAHAASYMYANNISTPEAQPRYSGLRPIVSGGSAIVLLGVGSSVHISYYDYPGYTQLGFAKANAPLPATINHAAFSNAFAQCYWTLNGVGGSADLRCTVAG